MRKEFESVKAKWHDDEIALKEYSLEHRDIVFKLKGFNEDGDVVWIKYFLNGKMQLSTAKIVFDEFDVNKLI